MQTDGVYTLHLPAGCYLDHDAPIRALALACPGVDYIRLWPLPVEQPWEDPTDMPEPIPGGYTRVLEIRAELLAWGIGDWRRYKTRRACVNEQ